MVRLQNVAASKEFTLVAGKTGGGNWTVARMLLKEVRSLAHAPRLVQKLHDQQLFLFEVLCKIRTELQSFKHIQQT